MPNLFKISKRRLRGEPIEAFKFIKGMNINKIIIYLAPEIQYVLQEGVDLTFIDIRSIR